MHHCSFSPFVTESFLRTAQFPTQQRQCLFPGCSHLFPTHTGFSWLPLPQAISPYSEARRVEAIYPKMLRSLIIMAGSGIVVFEKSWEKGVQRDLVCFRGELSVFSSVTLQANQWGGLVRAVIEFSKQSVGIPMSYLEAGEGE